jgi:hypothetical protein
MPHWLRMPPTCTLRVGPSRRRLTANGMHSKHPRHQGSACAARAVDECLELARHLLVDYRREPLPLATHAKRVAVRLDEADVRLNRRAFVLDPVPACAHSARYVFAAAFARSPWQGVRRMILIRGRILRRMSPCLLPALCASIEPCLNERTYAASISR